MQRLIEVNFFAKEIGLHGDLSYNIVSVYISKSLWNITDRFLENVTRLWAKNELFRNSALSVKVENITEGIVRGFHFDLQRFYARKVKYKQKWIKKISQCDKKYYGNVSVI